MKCTYCSCKETKVIDKRNSDNDTIRRRRECLRCRKRFTTHEKPETAPLQVIKKDGRREAFDKEKIMRGMRKACEKRPISTAQIQALIEKIETKLRRTKNSEVQSTVIGEEVMKHLKQFDKVAYIRFASVYRPFADIAEFKQELQDITK